MRIMKKKRVCQNRHILLFLIRLLMHTLDGATRGIIHSPKGGIPLQGTITSILTNK